MKTTIDAHGLSPEQIETALDNARRFKNGFRMEDWNERYKKIIKEIVTLDPEFATELLKLVKEHHPDLLKDI